MRTALLGLILILSGCATILAPHEVAVTFESSPSGQTITVDGKPLTTPSTVQLSTRTKHQVQYPDGSVQEIGRDFQPWFIVDVVLLSPLLILIDVVTGGVNWNISPRTYHYPREAKPKAKKMRGARQGRAY